MANFYFGQKQSPFCLISEFNQVCPNYYRYIITSFRAVRRLIVINFFMTAAHCKKKKKIGHTFSITKYFWQIKI